MGMTTIMVATRELKFDLISKSSIIIMRFLSLGEDKGILSS